MNRHERRKQKKTGMTANASSTELNQAIQLHTKKSFDEAESLYKKIIALESQNYEAIRHLGILYHDTKRKENAYNLFQRAIKISPNRCEAYNNLGNIHLENMNYPLAEKCFDASITRNGLYLPALNNLVALYLKIGNKKQALLTSERVIASDPTNPITQNQYAKALIANNQLKKGITVLESLCKNHPIPDFLLNLSIAYRELGETEKANDIIKNEFKKNYTLENFFHAFAKIKGEKLNPKQEKYYADIIEKEFHSKPDLNRKVLICESFYEYFRNSKNYAESAKFLKKMNEIQYSLSEFSVGKEESFFLDMKSAFTSPKLVKMKNQENKLNPIIICGMPRSGTTLCEQILSSHSNVVGAGELDYLANLSGLEKLIETPAKNFKKFLKNIENHNFIEKLRDEYIELLSSHVLNDEQYVCDKMPHNFILIGLIKTILPESHIIYCKREPMDNCFSLYAHKWVEMSHQYSYNQNILCEYYKKHEDIMEYWLKMYSDIYTLDNESLVYNQKKITKELLAFCDLPWEPECLEFHQNKRQVRTASIDQVRKPINNKSIGAWKNYDSILLNMKKAFKING